MRIDYVSDMLGFSGSDADAVAFTGGAACAGLETAFAAAPDAAALALRTAPFEAANCCDPVTLEAFCAYNAAFAVRTDALRAVGGVDRRMGACAAADLLLRLKAAGLAVRYAPGAVVRAALSPVPAYADRLLGGLMLRIRHGSFSDIVDGKLLILKALLHPEASGVRRGALLRRFVGLFGPAWAVFFARYGAGRSYKGGLRVWYGAWPGFSRGEWCAASSAPDDAASDPAARGAAGEAGLAAPGGAQNGPGGPARAERPLVSIITRTRKRPETLRMTLESLRRQTYSPFEIVVVEDGAPDSEQMIRADFADLPITYRATGENIGRAAAFNLGVSLARGTLLNMLDDDDFLLPEHLELGVAELARTGADLLFLRGMALEVDKLSDAPYAFAVRARRALDFPRIEPFTMVRRCLTTEQGVLFEKSLCERVGGMRPELHAHEDWNLWLRMMAAGRYAVLPYVTNCYLVPFDREAERARLEQYAKYDDELLEDDALVFHTTRAQLDGYYTSLIHDLAYLESLGALDAHLATECDKARAYIEKRRVRPASFALLADAREINLDGRQLKELYCTAMINFAQKGGALPGFLKAELARLAREDAV